MKLKNEYSMLYLETDTLNTTENNNILKIQFIFHVVDRSSQWSGFLHV